MVAYWLKVNEYIKFNSLVLMLTAIFITIKQYLYFLLNKKKVNMIKYINYYLI